MGGDGQALQNKRKHLVGFGRGMHKGADHTEAPSVLVVAKKRLRQEGGQRAPTSSEWHSMTIQDQIGRCRSSLDTLPDISCCYVGAASEDAAPPSVVVDGAGYLYSATSLVDYLLHRATLKGSNGVADISGDSLAHIKKFKRDTRGVAQLNGQGVPAAPSGWGLTCAISNKCLSTKNPQVRQLCLFSAVQGGFAPVIFEDALRECWLSEINAQLKQARTEGRGTVELSIPTTATPFLVVSLDTAAFLRTYTLTRPYSTIATESPPATHPSSPSNRVASVVEQIALVESFNAEKVSGLLNIFAEEELVGQASENVKPQLPWFTELQLLVIADYKRHAPNTNPLGHVVELLPQTHQKASLSLALHRLTLSLTD